MRNFISVILEWSSGFPYFLQFQSEFGNKFMIWAIVNSWSCFRWLYRAFPFLAATNIISLISVLTIWWCPCVESSLVFLLWPVHFLGKTLLAFALLHSVLQIQICLLPQVFRDPVVTAISVEPHPLIRLLGALLSAHIVFSQGSLQVYYKHFLEKWPSQ